MTLPRMNRLFGADGKCVQIAMDHALFNEYELLEGLESFDRVLELAVRSRVDALLLSPGHAHRLQRLNVSQKPALVMRADGSNVYDPVRPVYCFSQMIDDPVERALRLDAAAVLLNFFLVPDNPEVHHQCIGNVCRIKPQCERYGMPLILEPLVLLYDEASDRYVISGELGRALPLHRQAVELGADILKADPTASVEDYDRLVELVGDVPLLPRGGGKVGDREILTRTHAMVKAGASGVVYGRNIFQHPSPLGMVRAIKAVVHDGTGVEEALGLIREA